MKRHLEPHFTTRYLLSSVLACSLVLPLPSLAASVALATSPLATSTTSTVKPNLLLVLDNSGSMDWDHMPDDSSDGGSAVTFSFGYYGLRSSQCNQVYYNPAITYQVPVYADGTSYPAASFTAASTDGFDTAASTVNLNTDFRASLSLSGDSSGHAAYYFSYSGTQDTPLEKNYHSTTNDFYKECHSANGATPGSTVFSKRRLATAETATIAISGTGGAISPHAEVSGIKVNGFEIMNAASATVGSISSSTMASNIAAKINLCTAAASGNCTVAGYSASAAGSTITITGPTSAANYSPVISTSGSMGSLVLTPEVFPLTTAANLTNFANWYSYYRTRMLMMKTAAGRAFSSLNNSYRVGLMKISSSSTPALALGTFEGAQRTNWYSTLYGISPSGSTPLRTALSNSGRYYAGRLSGTDPVQYSCQQNFTILSTDGYWNTGDGFQLDGSTAVGNQDGTAARPMNDGAQAGTTVVTTYTRNTYSRVSTGCSGSKKKLKTQPQIGTCRVTTVGGVPGVESCTWVNNGSATNGSCASSVTLPSPNPSARVQVGSPVETPGSTGGTSDNLADIAMYYYQTDLRPGTCTLCTNNVFISSTDNNVQQHMTTFTLGLGASGRMTYSSSYLSDSTGDYVAVRLGSTADSTATPPVCSWQTNGTTCNWPIPGIDGSGNGFIENIDDLWHAAIDGHGAYFSATDPASLSAGLSNALAGINARKGSAAAAATSTLNPVAGNNFAFVASYTTVKWQGNLEERGINVDTGVVNENATWCVENVVAGSCSATGSIVADASGATTTYFCVTPNSVTCSDGVLDGTDCKVPVATACTGTMNAKVSDTNDTRTILTADSTGAALIPFDAAYATANPEYFAAAHISTLSQWSSLTTGTGGQQEAAVGTNLINFLRGQNGFEDRTTNAADNRLYRYREAVLGDALESQPAFMGKPVFSYPYPGYSDYLTAQVDRAGTVFMGANDGMMHAFASDTGIERWAYVPSMVIPNMWKLADKNYSTLHANFVNGNPVTTDVCTANCTNSATAVWRTILVAGLNGGGRGYYALDITVPDTPTLLWEFTPTTGNGTVKDDGVGYSFGQAVITKKIDGTWVALVTSGYNNTSPGDGKGYLYVLNASTGAVISKITTGAGNTATPSGLAKIAAWNNEPAGNVAGYVYGGDLLGNVWRFDINSSVAAVSGTGDVMKFATLFADTAGTSPQPITTTPVLGKIAGKRVVFIGTGKYLETSDLTTTQVQTQYAIKDDDATATLVNPRNTFVQQTLTDNPDGTATRLVSHNMVNFYTGRGWYIDFPDGGERVNIDSKLVEGTLLVPTIVPSNTVCSPGGYGWLNFFNYQTGGAVNTPPDLGSLKYDDPIVGFDVFYVQGRAKVGVVTSTNPTPELNPDVGFSASAAGFSGKRMIWRELIP